MTYFTGQFDKSRNPVWSAGDILFDSVYRFKGQSAPAVVVSEIDFEILSDSERKKLFVAMTRAEIELTMIMSERAEGLLMSRVGSCERNTLEVTVEQSFVQARCPPLSD